jgi:hypothetical protein
VGNCAASLRRETADTSGANRRCGEEQLSSLSIARFMVKLKKGGWGIGVRNPRKASAFATSSSGTVADGSLAGRRRLPGSRSRGRISLVAEKRDGSQGPEAHDRWPGWFRISFIVGATSALWGLIFHSL